MPCFTMRARSSNAANSPKPPNLYHQILRANPAHLEALHNLGFIYFQNGQFEAAQHLIGEALKHDPTPAEAHCVRGIALSHLGRHADAVACYDQALARQPDMSTRW